MKSFFVNGIERLVGSIKIPTVEEMEEFAKRGFFHEIFGISPDSTDPNASPIPAPPDQVDYITPAIDALQTMLGNGPDPDLPPGQGPVGDCVIAEDLHLAALRACNAGAPWVPTTAQALDAYSAVTGFKIGDPSTDVGTNPLDLIKYRLAGNTYPDGSTILDARVVDTSSEQRIKEAIWLADGVIMWASLPDDWESEEEGGDIWDIAGPPNPDNGHGFGGASYGQRIRLTEWGIAKPPIRLTFRAADYYCKASAGGGCIAFIGSNAFSNITKKCPAGYDLSQLKAYIDSLGPAA
jgi:hypothetical protein